RPDPNEAGGPAGAERDAERHGELRAERHGEAAEAPAAAASPASSAAARGLWTRQAVHPSIMRALMPKPPWFLAVALSLLFASVIASAQPKKKTLRDELPPAAQSAWDDAIRATGYNPPEWDKAAASFQQAYEISKNPKVLFNVAVCERNLFHYAR